MIEVTCISYGDYSLCPKKNFFILAFFNIKSIGIIVFALGIAIPAGSNVSAIIVSEKDTEA